MNQKERTNQIIVFILNLAKKFLINERTFIVMINVLVKGKSFSDIGKEELKLTPTQVRNIYLKGLEVIKKGLVASFDQIDKLTNENINLRGKNNILRSTLDKIANEVHQSFDNLAKSFPIKNEDDFLERSILDLNISTRVHKVLKKK